MNIQVTKTFANREELDSFVKSRFGDDASKNIEVSLVMSAEEMSKLALDESTTVHGARVSAEVEDEVMKSKAPKLGGRGKPSKVRKSKKR